MFKNIITIFLDHFCMKLYCILTWAIFIFQFFSVYLEF